MSRYVKERMVEQYAQRFQAVTEVAVVNTEGISVSQMVAFRAALRERGLQAMRIQNRLCRRAVQEGSLVGADVLFVGPTTLVWGGSGIVDIAKVLTDEAKELKALEIRGGFSAGEVLSKEQIQSLSELPSREELIGGLVARAVGQVGRIVSLATGVAGALASQIREFQKTAPAEASARDTAEETVGDAEKPTESGEAEAPDQAADAEAPAETQGEPAEAEQPEPEAGQADETPESNQTGQEESEES